MAKYNQKRRGNNKQFFAKFIMDQSSNCSVLKVKQLCQG